MILFLAVLRRWPFSVVSACLMICLVFMAAVSLRFVLIGLNDSALLWLRQYLFVLFYNLSML
jgi:hypothetical protein